MYAVACSDCVVFYANDERGLGTSIGACWTCIVDWPWRFAECAMVVAGLNSQRKLQALAWLAHVWCARASGNFVVGAVSLVGGFIL